jgi:hypothetical protein
MESWIFVGAEGGYYFSLPLMPSPSITISFAFYSSSKARGGEKEKSIK